MTTHPIKNQILNQLDQQQKNFVQQQGGFNRSPVPLYSYYDSTSKYLSQSLLNEKSKQINYNTNGDQMLNFNNLNILIRLYISSLELINLLAGNVYLLTIISPFLPLASPW